MLQVKRKTIWKQKLEVVYLQDIREKYRSIFPAGDKSIWQEILHNIEHISEIRIRAGKPIMIYLKQREVSIDKEGKLIYVPENGKIISYKELQELLDFWCMDSRYAFQNEIKRGFLTIEGGHRIGICGEMVSDAEGNIKSIKYISAVNIRIAHEVKGVAEKIMMYIYGRNKVENTLIMSPPGAGKTTLLRDIVRQLSFGNEEQHGVNVGLVDERGEIAACFQGIPQLDVGPRTDVLDNCPKITGMRMLLRSMAPHVIAVDELGEAEEIHLIQQMAGNGCAVIATIHSDSIEELKKKQILHEIWKQQIFRNIVCLSKDKERFHMEVFQGKDEKLCYKC